MGMVLLVSLLCSALFLILVLAAVWWFDRYDREPVHLVAAVFVWGITAALMLAGPILQLVPGKLDPFVEELLKALGVVGVVLFSREFDDSTDGVVYGTASGLGFAVGENCLALMSPGQAGGGLELLLARTLTTSGVHAVASAAVGGLIGIAYLTKGILRRGVLVLSGLVLGTLIHSSWNQLIVVYQEGIPLFWLLPLFVAYLCVLSAFLLWEKRVIRAELMEEVELGVLPEWVVSVIPYYRRRISSTWWPRRRERVIIARLLTRLAFRKYAARKLPEAQAKLAALEVMTLRKRASEILRGGGFRPGA